MSLVGHSATENHVCDDGSFPQKRKCSVGGAPTVGDFLAPSTPRARNVALRQRGSAYVPSAATHHAGSAGAGGAANSMVDARASALLVATKHVT